MVNGIQLVRKKLDSTAFFLFCFVGFCTRNAVIKKNIENIFNERVEIAILFVFYIRSLSRTISCRTGNVWKKEWKSSKPWHPGLFSMQTGVYRTYVLTDGGPKVTLPLRFLPLASGFYGMSDYLLSWGDFFFILCECLAITWVPNLIYCRGRLFALSSVQQNAWHSDEVD